MPEISRVQVSFVVGASWAHAACNPSSKTMVRTVNSSPPANIPSPTEVPSLHRLCQIGTEFGTSRSISIQTANKSANASMECHLLRNSRRDSHAHRHNRLQHYLLLYER